MDEDAKKCTVQTGAAKQKLKAKEGAVFGIVGALSWECRSLSGLGGEVCGWGDGWGVDSFEQEDLERDQGTRIVYMT